MRSPRTEKTRTHILPNLPSGYLRRNQAACLTMTLRRCLPRLLPQFKTRGSGRSLDSDTIFSIFCSTVTEDIWKLALVWFWKGLVRVEFPSQMALCRCADCCFHRWRKQEGETAEVALSLPVFRTRSDSVNTTQCFQHVPSVSSWHTASHVYLFYLGVHACCVSDLTPCQRSAVFTHEEEEFKTQNTTNQIFR